MSLFSNFSAEILILLFLIITFLQSGFDKLTDWKGNVSFIKDHFKNSPLKNMVPILLAIILILEIIAGVLMSVGIYQLINSGAPEFALLGIKLSALTLIFFTYWATFSKRLCRSDVFSGLFYYYCFRSVFIK